MNVYDFDNTIYDGESAVDFYKFCIRRKPRLVKLFPLMMYMLVKYKLCIISKNELAECIAKYSGYAASAFTDITETVEEFWDKNINKIKSFYLESKHDDDIILTASFGFLIEPACKRLGINKLICSDIDINTCELKFLCFRDNKVSVLKEHLIGDEEITFYTDSMNDKSMIDFADHAYMVKGDKLEKLK